jgi:hypothetical protein
MYLAMGTINLRSSSTSDWDGQSWGVLRDAAAAFGPECKVSMTVLLNGGKPVRIEWARSTST